jgi:hypothetical protein
MSDNATSTLDSALPWGAAAGEVVVAAGSVTGIQPAPRA